MTREPEKGPVVDRDLGDEGESGVLVRPALTEREQQIEYLRVHLSAAEFGRLMYLEHLVSSGRVKADGPERGA